MNTSQDTIDSLRKALAEPSADLAKSFTQSGSPTTGLTYYDLEAPAKTLYPVITPLRNEIPRVSGKGGIQANWKAVTGVNTTRIGLGVMEGARGRVINTTTADYNAAYRGLGLEDWTSFEAQYAGQGFEDVRNRMAQGLLRSFMIGEEQIILGGNASMALGTTPTPTTAAAAGGALPAATYSVICIALSHEAYFSSTLADGVPVSGNVTTASGDTQFVRTGNAAKSAAASQAATANQLITASVTPVRGAFGYAWYIGAAGAERLTKITTINSVSLTDASATGQLATAHNTTDYSTNTAVHDGYLTFAAKSGNGGYFKQQASGTAGVGTPLTSSGDGGIAEFDEALLWFWDNWRLSPDEIWVSGQEAKNIRAKIMNAPSTAAQRFMFTMNKDGIIGGSAAVSYLNPFGMAQAKELAIKIHPNMPNGTVFFNTKTLPYPLSDVDQITRILARQDYYAIEWPLRTRKYEMGVYSDQVMQCYAPFSLGVITNIGNG